MRVYESEVNMTDYEKGQENAWEMFKYLERNTDAMIYVFGSGKYKDNLFCGKQELTFKEVQVKLEEFIKRNEGF